MCCGGWEGVADGRCGRAGFWGVWLPVLPGASCGRPRSGDCFDIVKPLAKQKVSIDPMCSVSVCCRDDWDQGLLGAAEVCLSSAGCSSI